LTKAPYSSSLGYFSVPRNSICSKEEEEEEEKEEEKTERKEGKK